MLMIRKSCLDFCLLFLFIQFLQIKSQELKSKTSNLVEDSNFSQLYNQQKRGSGFVPMRGRKNDYQEQTSNSNVDQNQNNDKTNIAKPYEWDFFKSLNNIFNLNKNGNLEDQLILIDKTPLVEKMPTVKNNENYFYEENYQEPFLKNRLRLPQQPNKILNWMSQYVKNSPVSPKRAGFVPMRGRKKDPNVIDENELINELSYYIKRTGFMPMRGKKMFGNSEENEDQYDKRTFHALRG